MHESSGMKLQFRVIEPQFYVPNPDYPEKSKDKYLMVVNPEDLFFKDTPESFVKENSAECGHSETACDICVDSWRLDHEFRYVRSDAQGEVLAD
jgi:hypothetical protein